MTTYGHETRDSYAVLHNTRCEILEHFCGKVNGENSGDLIVTLYEGEEGGNPGYVVVSDGADTWLAKESEYLDAVETVCERIINGVYDSAWEADTIDAELYEDLCKHCPCIYSQIGTADEQEEIWNIPASVREQLIADGYERFFEEVA